MSGVAKDDTNPSSTSEETVSAVGDAEAGQAESPETSSADSEHRARRAAPHLRVVGEDEDFIAPATATAELTPDLPHQRIGALLRARRENLGYSLDQVSKETRVHLSHLRAIEEMTPGLLGAPVYAKGYIRSYARHLGLDEMSTLERYLSECAILKDPEKQDIAPPATGRRLPAALPVLGFLIIALAGAAVAFFVMNGDKPTASADTTDAATTVKANEPPQSPSGILAAAPATDAVAPAQNLRIVAVKRGLLEVRSANGDKYVRRYYEPGESYTPRIGAGWTVTAPEDGSAFEWRLGDQSLGLLGESGPVYAQSVDIAAKRPPVVLETTQPEATPAPATTAAPPAPGATTTTPPAAAGAAPAPARPRVVRPRPETQANLPAQPPATTSAASPPVAAPPAPAQTTPAAKDPALAAYPDQQPGRQ